MRSLRKALTSICLTRSRVKSIASPISSSVWDPPASAPTKVQFMYPACLMAKGQPRLVHGSFGKTCRKSGHRSASTRLGVPMIRFTSSVLNSRLILTVCLFLGLLRRVKQ